jgi:DNA-binding MarR family transcriptional regulator
MNGEKLVLFMEPGKRYTVKALADALVEDHSDVVFALERLKRYGFVRERESQDLCYALTTPGVRLREIIINRS